MSGIQNLFISNSSSSSSSPLYIDHGTSAPEWNSTATAYSSSQTNINYHYGMGTDTFHRYLIVWSRGYSTGGPPYYCSWIPITENGLDLNGIVRLRFVNSSFTPGNSFGGFADTIRGYALHQLYNQVTIQRYNLPTNLKNRSETAPDNFANSGEYDNNYLSSHAGLSIGFNRNDGGYHNYADDSYYICGRSSQEIKKYTPDGNYISNYTPSGLHRSQGYGICKDPSSNYWIMAHRNTQFSRINPDLTTGSVYSNIQTPWNTEDAVIGWTGDLYLKQATSGGSIYRYARQ